MPIFFIINPKSRLRLWASDMIQQVFADRYGKISVIETASDTGKRPDTLMQVQQEARRLAIEMKRSGMAEHPERSEYHIQLVSGQPSVTRQALLAQRAVNEALRQEGIWGVIATVHGIGADANVRLETLQSEIAALLNQRYLTATEHQFRKRPAENLMFQTRPNRLESTPLLPARYAHGITGGVEAQGSPAPLNTPRPSRRQGRLPPLPG